MTESCETCKYSRKHNDGVHLRCCFNPPTVVSSTYSDGIVDNALCSGVDTGWPVVAQSDWCGKHEKK